jgi:monoamine oxidase
VEYLPKSFTTTSQLYEKDPSILRYPVEMNEVGKTSEELLLLAVQPIISIILIRMILQKLSCGISPKILHYNIPIFLWISFNKIAVQPIINFIKRNPEKNWDVVVKDFGRYSTGQFLK